MEGENKRLIPMTIKHLDGDNWLISIENGESYSVDGDFDSIRKVCRRIKAKDGETNNSCRSAKIGTYASMISADDNEEHKINVWKSKVPHSAEDFKKLMENKDMSKSITLSKNYLIEGNIIPKGTIVEFKEKLDFLPTDIWEKAKSINDEHERFEFIKTELNKLGDDYSDDEIEDFINKYKNELNESKKDASADVKKISKDDLDSMILLIKETLESEKNIKGEKAEKIIDELKTNKKVITAWENLIYAEDKSFRKNEIIFWNAVDEFLKSIENVEEK